MVWARILFATRTGGTHDVADYPNSQGTREAELFSCLQFLRHKEKRNSFDCLGFLPFQGNFFALRRIRTLSSWPFFLCQVLDFCDTVFIILKKSWRRLSFLHVYHHSSILFVYWVCMNAGYDGDIYYTVVLNSFIHFLMYGYYLATTLNVSIPTPIKKLVTNMQATNFFPISVLFFVKFVLFSDDPICIDEYSRRLHPVPQLCLPPQSD